uniref:Uncharacterized protein n=1 Tax=viral metagenome TaxID=1070528 RepID=A0A6M3LMW4_9ZZZZ
MDRQLSADGIGFALADAVVNNIKYGHHITEAGLVRNADH